MKFKKLVQLYETPFTKRAGPPYIEIDNRDNKRYFKDRGHSILHRTEKDPETGLTLPAVERADGAKFWFKNGRRHRDEKDPATGLSLPAIEYSNGDKCWYKDHKRDRTDGPAIVWENGNEEWWINDIPLTSKQIKELKETIEIKKKIFTPDNPLSSLRDLF